MCCSGECQRKLPIDVLTAQEANFALYERVLSQQPKDRDKVYSLHDPAVYCVGKGKDHKAYEYGRKASVVATKESQVIVGVVSHDEHDHDSKTLKAALTEAHTHRETSIRLAVVDRGYRGAKNKVDCEVLLPGPPLKRDNAYQRQKKRILCRKRSAIEPIIGHLKHDHRLLRSWLKGAEGDRINLLMAGCAWNLRKWMIAFFLFEKPNGGEQTLLAIACCQPLGTPLIVVWVLS
ncbi:MAG: transposase [Gammaproteobacteria bacterium]|nr:transposase [Gammaproteobacteria bacterium]